MPYGQPIEDIQDDYDEAEAVVQQETGTYTNGDTYANTLAKGATVVEQEEVEGYGDSYETVAAGTPVVEQSTAAYEGIVDVIKEPTVVANVVTIPVQTGVVYVDADTYDPEGDPVVIDVLTGTVELDDTEVTELNVLAVPAEDYTFGEDVTTEWAFAYEA